MALIANRQPPPIQMMKSSFASKVTAMFAAWAASVAAQSTTSQSSTDTDSNEKEKAVVLSPFEVTESNNGYYGGNTMSGTRLNTRLDDLASSISVVTKEQMADFGMVDINDIFAYETSTEGTGNYTEFDVNRKGQSVDRVQDDPNSTNRIRGVGRARSSIDGFTTSGRMPIDPLIIDAVEISRGPNSNIFGLGEGAGTVNMVSAGASLNRLRIKTELRGDSNDGFRASIDMNQPLIKNKLAVRVSAGYDRVGFQRKPSGFDSRRYNAMFRAQPFSKTTIRGSIFSYTGFGNRANAITPRDAVTPWINAGSPTWDPVTSTVTVNGVKAVTGTTNPAGLIALSRNSPVRFVDQTGLQLWEISRMPAANATNGPNSTTGAQRLLESAPYDPKIDSQPLWDTVAGVSNRSIYDYSSINISAPNYTYDKVRISTVQLEQFLFNTGRHTAAFQIGWQNEDSQRQSNGVIGSVSGVGKSNYLYIDPNERLLDGSVNPFFRRPYIAAPETLSVIDRPYKRDSYRAQLAYILDLRDSKSKWVRWLGRHQILGYYEYQRSEEDIYRYRDALINDNPIYAPAGQSKGNQAGSAGFPPSPNATRGNYHYYMGDASGYNVDYAPGRAELGNYTFKWYNPQVRLWVSDPATLGRAAVTEASAGKGAVLNVLKTKGLMLQNNFFGDKLITTFGWRHDETNNKFKNSAALLPNGYEFDYSVTDHWIGDWDVDGGNTSTKGAVLRPFRGWGFMEQAKAAPGLKGALASIFSNIGFFYNESDSFQPEKPVYNFQLQQLPTPTSEGKDYGITINLGSKLRLRVNKFTTRVVNLRANEGTNMANRLFLMDFDSFGANTVVFSLQRQARLWVAAGNPSLTPAQVETAALKVIGYTAEQEQAFRSTTVSDTMDVVAKGQEYELNYNPTKSWTLRANVTRSESIDSNIYPNNNKYLKERLAYWETIIDPRTGKKWLDISYAGDTPVPAGRDKARSYLTTFIQGPLGLESVREGKTRAEIRKWRFNLATSYRLSGITDHKILRNFTVGGGVRWESRAAIGYYGVPVNGDYFESTEYDGNNPVYDKAHSYFDGFVTYRTKLFNNKINARFQLNVRNIQESRAHLQPIAAYPNGVASSFRIIDPRTFILTSSFEF